MESHTPKYVSSIRMRIKNGETVTLTKSDTPNLTSASSIFVKVLVMHNVSLAYRTIMRFNSHSVHSYLIMV